MSTTTKDYFASGTPERAALDRFWAHTATVDDMLLLASSRHVAAAQRGAQMNAQVQQAHPSRCKWGHDQTWSGSEWSPCSTCAGGWRPFEVGDRVVVDWETSRMHGELGVVIRVRRGDSNDDWQALTTSEQFPYCDPIWFGFRALRPALPSSVEKSK